MSSFQGAYATQVQRKSFTRTFSVASLDMTLPGNNLDIQLIDPSFNGYRPWYHILSSSNFHIYIYKMGVNVFGNESLCVCVCVCVEAQSCQLFLSWHSQKSLTTMRSGSETSWNASWEILLQPGQPLSFSKLSEAWPLWPHIGGHCPGYGCVLVLRAAESIIGEGARGPFQVSQHRKSLGKDPISQQYFTWRKFFCERGNKEFWMVKTDTILRRMLIARTRGISSQNMTMDDTHTEDAS